MKDLKQISNDSFYKMEDYHQITIDLIQDTEDLFMYADEDINNITDRNQIIESLGALCYDIMIILEVFNPNFENEISDLKDLEIHINNKIEELKLLKF
jgi:hypothetical protein